MSTRSLGVRCLFALLLMAVSLPALSAQVARPARPDSYDVQLRYRIRTDRDERIRQFRAMEGYLKEVGFTAKKKLNEDLDIFDPAAELLVGTIDSANAFKLLKQPSIQTVILTPAGTMAVDAKKMVQVRLYLGTGLPSDQQQKLHGQVVAHLRQLGFVEALAYDHDRYTNVRGALPAGNVSKLLKDLRSVPAGWLLTAQPRELLPSPLMNVLPIRVVEVLPDLPEATPLPFSGFMGKFTPEVLAIAADPARQELPLVVEVVLDEDADLISREARGRLRTTGAGATLEGFAGTIATLRLPKAKLLDRLSLSPLVQAVRMPRASAEAARPALASDPIALKPSDVVRAANLDALHSLGYRGDGLRAVVIASAFDGLELVKEDKPRYAGFIAVRANGLPAAWLLDFTGEASPTITSKPIDADRPGYGTQSAVALSAAAPGADILLVRVDPTAFHQIFDIAKAVVGLAGYTAALQSRLEDSGVNSDLLLARRRQVVDEYRKAFTNLSDDEIPRKRRSDAAAAMSKLQADEAVFKYQVDRFVAMKSGLDSLKGSRVVVNTLVWESGYPNDGLSSLSRLIDDRYTTSASKSAIKPDKNPPPPVWVQASSIAVGQVWNGTFRDADNNRIMEFTPTTTPVPANRWSRELNFLSYTTSDGKVAATIPTGTRVRISMQWREPHNRDEYLTEEPAYPMRLRVMRQLDPEGKALAADELVEVARSAGPTIRLLKTPGSGVYEVTTELTAPMDGVYAFRVEGSNVERDVIPSLRQAVEFHPRIVIEMLDGAQAMKGQVKFETYWTQTAGVAVPGDSTQAVAVGTGTPAKPTCMTGAGPSVTLRTKPEVYTAGSLTMEGKTYTGTAIAAGYAAGAAASLATAGVRETDLVRTVGLKPGDELILPLEWLQTLKPKKPATE